MTLDEAIAHACEIAQNGGGCAAEHGQLADWLGELREQRGKADMYRRQLGGTQAALNRSKQRCKELEQLVLDMRMVIAVHEGDGGYTAGEHFDGRMAKLGLKDGKQCK